MNATCLPLRYITLSILGEGGSGRVYRVHDSIRNLNSALKLVSATESKWLRREFDTLRQIRHENLIQVFDWGTLDSGEAYYTMELVDGGDWGGRMQGVQSSEDVRRILVALLRGLALLHSHSEIHGDLKPGNILLGGGGLVKVTDVGMGGSSATASDSSGTPGYAAPEIWERKSADVRSDLYSVGVMAYEALTGKHPFAGRTVREVVSGQLEGWVPSPAAHGIRVPLDLERSVMRALERNPALRQGSADEFMEELGIEDRIGEILGGPLVDRQEELASIEGLFSETLPGGHTLVHVVGPPGSGRTTLVEEVLHRAAAAGARVSFASQSTGLSVAGLIQEIKTESRAVEGSRVEAVPTGPEALWEIARETPVCISFDPPESSLHTVDSFVRPLARYLWALSLESGTPSKFVILITRAGAPPNVDEFEQQVRVESFGESTIKDLVSSMLGTAEVGDALAKRLWELSGGMPGPLWLVLRDLIDKGLLSRNRGKWAFRELEQLDAIAAPTLSNRWERAWADLPDADRNVLAALALLTSGIDVGSTRLTEALGIERGALALLEAKGWLKTVSGRSHLASEGIREVVTARGAPLIKKCARILLAEGSSLLDRERRADLVLLTAESSDALEEGLWAASQAEERGDLVRAKDRYRRCLELAGDVAGRYVGQIAYRLARVLHRLGNDVEASALLSSSASKDGSLIEGSIAARREHLLGLIEGSRGQIEAARAHLESATALADEAGERALALQSHADLAELEWRYGDEASRGRSIERIKSVLSAVGGDAGLATERSALVYGLGAALIVKGDTVTAKNLLASGLEETSSDYWRARISNALGSASASLGENEKAMQWYLEAWRNAEKADAVLLKSRILANRGAILHATGRIQESIDLDRQAAIWARRVGNKFDYAAARAGTAIGLIHLAWYEEALVDASEATKGASDLSDDQEVLKGMELEALALFHMGAYGQAVGVLKRTDEIIGRVGSTRAGPRLNWLWGRVLRATGLAKEAAERLRKAEAELGVVLDLEDLGGVQIELHSLIARQETASKSINAIREIMASASAAGILISEVSGALAIAEILGGFDLDDRSYTELLLDALGRAERHGFVEITWRTSYWLGVFAARHGDMRGSQSRLSHALRHIREIAGRLSPQHRELYLNQAHIRSAMKTMTVGA